jgi:hypothetical protein
VSQKIRQNCRPEVSCPMHIVDAIAFKRKALRCAKVMITHMGFHAMVPGAGEQGRAAQLVNPLRAYSRSGQAPMIAIRAKPQVAGCNDDGTRRSRRRGRADRRPAQLRSAVLMDRFSAPLPPCAGVDQAVHRLSLRWTALCAPESAAPVRRPATAATPGPAAGRQPVRRTPRLRRARCAATWAGQTWPAVGQNSPAGVMAPALIDSDKPVPHTPRGNADFESINALPFYRAAQRTCPAQFTDRAVMGVIR